MSSSDTAVSVRGLSKAYTIAHDQERHVTLAETILARVKNPLRKPTTETFWALKDVNFEIKKGEVVGIIGRNGAGKSTLLKVLSRITEPSAGEIDLHGRVGSLLEVGTGFHPELTGRENIYLNGAILGMTKGEIRRQFDAIVDFAGVEKFLDTPVKRYSSGMYVRLAFAVAAHLASEILIVDEVLAVGDSAFQKKCLGKMRDVASGGRTVLFVSHNMNALLELCSEGVLLEAGHVTRQGLVTDVINAYILGGAEERESIPLSGKPRSGNIRSGATIDAIRMSAETKVGAWVIPFGETIGIEIEINVDVPLEQAEVGISLFTITGVEISSSLTSHSFGKVELVPGKYRVAIAYPGLRLVPGHYRIGVGIRSVRGMEDFVPEAVEFEVCASELSNGWNLQGIHALVLPTVKYEISDIDSLGNANELVFDSDAAVTHS